MTENNKELQPANSSGCTGYHLKLIALITMLIDHVGAVVVWRVLESSWNVDSLINQELLYTIYECMRLIGRMAFPIYCFLIVEGFLHTSNVKKYLLRLLVFALISEVPFDLAITGQWWSMEYSNVFFTLALGLLLIWLVSYVELFHEFWKEKKWDNFVGTLISVVALLVLCVVLGGVAEMVLRTDYGMAGVFSILVIYLLRKQKELGFAAAVLLLSIMSSSTEIVALLMLVPIYHYNGQRGAKTKYLFYAFYPAHLLVLALICMGIGV